MFVNDSSNDIIIDLVLNIVIDTGIDMLIDIGIDIGIDRYARYRLICLVVMITLAAKMYPI
jgi:hypothetical protein